jgi:hypothetical protein
MLLIKLAVAMVMVIGITSIAERASSRFAGVLLGFPLGAGLSLLFIGLEQGADFAARSGMWTMQGLLPTLLWCLSYQYLANNLRQWPRFGALTLSLILSLCCYLLATLLVMSFAAPSSVGRLLFSLVGLFIMAVIFRRTTPPSGTIRPLAFSPLLLVGRAMLTGLIILVITGCAARVGSQWSGVFSAFPATILPVVLILHTHYGPGILNALFCELPMGMLAIIIFSLMVAWSYPILGVGTGTVLSYAIAGLYLLVYELWLRKALQRQLDRLNSATNRVEQTAERKEEKPGAGGPVEKKTGEI